MVLVHFSAVNQQGLQGKEMDREEIMQDKAKMMIMSNLTSQRLLRLHIQCMLTGDQNVNAL